MTNIFYDTEFIDDGNTIDLISIGMVCEDGSEYYAVSGEFSKSGLANSEWLVENVFPSLPHDDKGRFDLNHPDVKTRAQIAGDVRSFILSIPEPELWAWYGAYDHVALAQLFGPMINLPVGIPMYTNELRQLYREHGNPRFPAQARGEHNALEDARHNKVKYDWIMTGV